MLQWQSNDEPASLPRRAFNCDLAPMSLHDVAYQRQAQSTSLGVMHQRISDSIKFLENFAMLLLRNSDSTIDDLKVDATVMTVETYAKVFLVRRVFHGIVHQIQ